MMYVFFSSVCLTLFFIFGAFALYEYLRTWFLGLHFTWLYYQQAIVLALIAFLCFIFAALFGTQIPDCYVH